MDNEMKNIEELITSKKIFLEELNEKERRFGSAVEAAFKKAILDQAFHYLSETEASMAILKILSLYELDAHDLLKSLAEHRIRILDLPPAGIFRLIDDLEEQGAIEAVPFVKHGNPSQKYRLLDFGRSKLQTFAPAPAISTVFAELATILRP